MADQEIKPGYKTTEFYLALAAQVIAYVIANAGITATSWPMTALGVALSLLGALGYTSARTSLKQ